MKKSVSGFLSRSYTNQTIHPQKMARGLSFRIYKKGIVLMSRINCVVSVQLICTFVFFCICKKQVVVYLLYDVSIFVWDCDRSLFCYAVRCVLSSCVIILLGKRKLVALLFIVFMKS